MTAIVTRGDAARLHLPDETVDLVVTSPPYFGLRSYQDGGEHYDGQIGDEATPAEYLDALMACTREWMRVLKPGGSIFVNLGDKYATAGTRQGNKGNSEGLTVVATAKHYGRRPEGFRDKSLMMLPQRYAIRCIDELGLILRAEIVWAKPNGLPESVTDRVRRSHEQVFHFVKQPRYYAAVDEIREPHTWGREINPEWSATRAKRAGATARNDERQSLTSVNPLGKLPGSVWSIPTAPLRVPAELGIDHFAAYPPELVRRIILGWSPREVCSVCGEGRRPVAERTGRVVSSSTSLELGGTAAHAYGSGAGRGDAGTQRIRTVSGHNMPKVERVAAGYACACPDTAAPATPGVVLDPFGGTGTTALVASVHGRVGISVDLSHDYCRLARWRTEDPGQRAKAAGTKPKPPRKPKPEPVADVIDIPVGQIDLFSEGESA